MPSFTLLRYRWCGAALVAALALALGTVLVAPQAAHAAGGSTLVNETFENASAADPRFIGLGSACLTAAPRPVVAAPPGGSALAGCAKTASSPAVATPG